MASIFDTSIVPASELTGAARYLADQLEQNQFTLAQYFPNQQINDITFSWNVSAGGLTEIADYRAYDTEADIGAREGFTRKTTELPSIARKILLSEYDNLMLRSANSELVDAVYDDVRRVIQAILGRVELARGKALEDGAYTHTGALTGLPATDFGRDAGHSTAASANWATSTTDILSDIATVIDTYTDTNGFAPGRMVVSSSILSNILANDQVKAQAWGGLSASPLVSRQGVSEIFSGLGYPDLHVYDAKVNIAGTPTRVITEDIAIFLPPAGVVAAGQTVYGTTLEAGAANLVGSAAPGLVAFTETTDRTPIHVWTGGSARVMPVLVNPDYTYALDTGG